MLPEEELREGHSILDSMSVPRDRIGQRIRMIHAEIMVVNKDRDEKMAQIAELERDLDRIRAQVVNLRQQVTTQLADAMTTFELIKATLAPQLPEDTTALRTLINVAYNDACTALDKLK